MLPGATTKTPRGSSPALAAGKRWSEAPVVQPGAMGGHGGVRGGCRCAEEAEHCVLERRGGRVAAEVQHLQLHAQHPQQHEDLERRSANGKLRGRRLAHLWLGELSGLGGEGQRRHVRMKEHHRSRRRRRAWEDTPSPSHGRSRRGRAEVDQRSAHPGLMQQAEEHAESEVEPHPGCLQKHRRAGTSGRAGPGLAWSGVRHVPRPKDPRAVEDRLSTAGGSVNAGRGSDAQAGKRTIGSSSGSRKRGSWCGALDSAPRYTHATTPSSDRTPGHAPAEPAAGAVGACRALRWGRQRVQTSQKAGSMRGPKSIGMLTTACSQRGCNPCRARFAATAL